MTVYNQISANKTRTYSIFAMFIFFISGFFLLIGKYFEYPMEYFALGVSFSLFATAASYFYSDQIVLSTTGARPATKQQFFDFYTVVENMSIAAGLPMPRLYVIDDPAPNAFATGRDPKHAVVCATTGLLGMMDRAELEGVIAHELSHVKNYDILLSSVVAVLVGTIGLVADWILRGMWFGGRRDDDRESGGNLLTVVFFVIVLIISPIVATLIQLAISRKREYLADASGALLTRYPEGLARALEKISSYPRSMRSANSATAHLFISNPLKKGESSSWFASLFSTHPPTVDRIRVLRNM